MRVTSWCEARQELMIDTVSAVAGSPSASKRSVLLRSGSVRGP